MGFKFYWFQVSWVPSFKVKVKVKVKVNVKVNFKSYATVLLSVLRKCRTFVATKQHAIL